MKYIKYLLVCLCLLWMPLIIVTADSGFDTSYDSGGSWNSGSSWDSGGSSGGSGSGEFDAVSFFIFLFIIIVVIIAASIEAGEKMAYKQKGWDGDIDDFFSKCLTQSQIDTVDPNILLPLIKDELFDIYVNVQNAWMNFDYDKLEQYTSDSLYNNYKMQLETLQLKGQKNIMNSFELRNFSVISLELEENFETIEVYMEVRFIDYIVDHNNKTVRGYANMPVDIVYEMAFIRQLNTLNNCPGCNALLDDKAHERCPYCNSIIINNNNQFVLTKKKNIRQR